MTELSLKETIQSAMKTALKEHDKVRLNAIRLIWAAIRQQEIDSQTTLDDASVLGLLDKMIKQRRDAIGQYQSANRQDLVSQEEAEIAVIQTFMPTPLSADEVDTLIQQAMEDSAATSMKDMAKVMALLKPALQGRADMGIVSKKIKERLT
ncbi:MAG: GatB/YqeY protein [Gammaproteobacteria bacterium]|nr:GatB/YqeY protein [Gammaproteobacteria bacterium]